MPPRGVHGRVTPGDARETSFPVFGGEVAAGAVGEQVAVSRIRHGQVVADPAQYGVYHRFAVGARGEARRPSSRRCAPGRFGATARLTG